MFRPIPLNHLEFAVVGLALLVTGVVLGIFFLTWLQARKNKPTHRLHGLICETTGNWYVVAEGSEREMEAKLGHLVLYSLNDHTMTITLKDELPDFYMVRVQGRTDTSDIRLVEEDNSDIRIILATHELWSSVDGESTWESLSKGTLSEMIAKRDHIIQNAGDVAELVVRAIEEGSPPSRDFGVIGPDSRG